MRRKHLIKLNDEEYQTLTNAQKEVKQHGISSFSQVAQTTVKDDALGSYVHLGSQLIIEHLQKRFPEGK